MVTKTTGTCNVKFVGMKYAVEDALTWNHNQKVRIGDHLYDYDDDDDDGNTCRNKTDVKDLQED